MELGEVAAGPLGEQGCAARGAGRRRRARWARPIDGGEGGDGRGARAGTTLLELMIAMIFMVIALAGLTGVVTSSKLANETGFEAAQGKEAARRALEAVVAADFGDAFALYNADPLDDPGGQGTAPGNLLAVPELELVPGDPDGCVGEIVLPAVVNAGGVLELREDVAMPGLGMPRDLNGDGLVDALDHSGDYRILPVMVRVVWNSKSGPAKVELRTQLANF